MFCQQCVHMIGQIDQWIDDIQFDEVKESFLTVDHHASYQSFKDALKVNSCFICVSMKSAFPSSEDSRFWLDMKCPTEVTIRRLTATRLVLLFTAVSEFCMLSVFAADDHSPRDATLLTIDSFTGHPTVLNEARSWLETCQNSHPQCSRQIPRIARYPSRLIDVSPEAWPDGSRIMLIEQDIIQTLHSPYMTLSHRWGMPHQHPFKLNGTSYTDLIQGLPVSKLSGTYRDAIAVTRHLGVRYLWIDSLCIFQDDKLNIIVEAYKMASVYGNSVCNISALQGRQDGIFASRDANQISPKTAIVCAGDYNLNHTYAISTDRIWKDAVLSKDLTRRGWVLQEQILARRTIYFGADQIFWACQEGVCCETFSMTNPMWQEDFAHPGIFDDLGCSWLKAVTISGEVANPKDIDHEVDDDSSGWDSWFHMIQEYSARDLTNPSDKLIAIAGIAELFQRQGGRLYAGHWELSLPLSLLWRVVPDEAQKVESRNESLPEKHSTQRAPSWSWASLDMKLDLVSLTHKVNKRQISQILGIDLQSSALSPCDLSVYSGCMTIQCPHLVLRPTRNGLSNISFMIGERLGCTNAASVQWPGISENLASDPRANGYFDSPDDESPANQYIALFLYDDMLLSEVEDEEVIVRHRADQRCQDAECLSGEDSQLIYYGLIVRILPPSDTEADVVECQRVGVFEATMSLENDESSSMTSLLSKWGLLDHEVNEDGEIVLCSFDTSYYNGSSTFAIR